MTPQQASSQADPLHEKLQEEITLLALGDTPDIPWVEVALHLASCVDCRQIIVDVSETAGLLAVAYGEMHPSDHVRDSLMRKVKADGSHSTGALKSRFLEDHSAADSGKSISDQSDHSTDDSSQKRRMHWNRRPNLMASRVGWVALFLIFLLGNALWWQHTNQQSQALASLEERYTSDIAWLRSAEHLLISGEPPTYRGELESETPQASHAAGQVALYLTEYDRLYLLIHATGLKAMTLHSVWIDEGDTRHQVGHFTSTETGIGNYVYAVDVSHWRWMSEETVVLGVQDESTARGVLVGTLEETTRVITEEI